MSHPVTLRLSFTLSILVTLLATPTRAADPLDDLELQYQTATAILKKPPVTGILITEVQPESAAAAAGIRAGDILLQYYGTKVSTLSALSQQIADAIARRIEDESVGKHVTARIRRGNEEHILSLPREILGIRALEVEAGVPGPRNPPPNTRGTLALDWKAALQTLRDDNETNADAAADGQAVRPRGTPAAFRLTLRNDPLPNATQPQRPRPADEDWIGWQLCTLTPTGDDLLTGTIDLYHLMPALRPTDDNTLNTEHSVFTFRLRLGDFKTTPAFLLEETTARYAAPSGQENMQFLNTAKRLGEKLQTTSGLSPLEGLLGEGGNRIEHHDNNAPLDAAPQCALPWIAAALPQEDGAAVALHLLSVRDFIPRPGYVLATRGRAPLPTDPIGADARPTSTSPATTSAAPLNPWRVDLVHAGIAIESYWFTNQRRLLCIQTQGPQSIIARRAENEKSAATLQEKKPPATQPIP